MVGKKDNEYTCLCAFTQDSFLYYAEVCKILEFYKRTGELMTETDDEEIRCKKCHMPLDGSTECPFCAKKSKVLHWEKTIDLIRTFGIRINTLDILIPKISLHLHLAM